MDNIANGKSEKESYELVLIFIVILLLIFGSAWLAQKSDIFISWWKVIYLPQAKAVAWFSSTFLGELVNAVLGHTRAQAESLVQFMANTPAHQMTGNFCWVASEFLGKYWLFIFMPIACYLTLKVYKSTQGESDVYQKFKNAKAFMQFVQKNALDAHELADEFNAEILDNSLSLMDFAKKHNLLIEDKKNKPNQPVRVNFKKVSECFIAQLGKPFTTMADLINQPYGWAALKIIQFIPEKYRNKIIENISQQHLYDFTVLLALLDAARKYGVITSALFIRLKKDYLALWYGLNNLGRKTIFVEGAGISSQYAYECEQKLKDKKKLKLKKVELAVEGFKEAINHG